MDKNNQYSYEPQQQPYQPYPQQSTRYAYGQQQYQQAPYTNDPVRVVPSNISGKILCLKFDFINV